MNEAGEIEAYYRRDEERDRLGGGKGRLEFERTQEIVLRNLPPAPATVADIGGGPGRYALWLADLGYTVVHRDLMPWHVDHLATQRHPRIDTARGDARGLDLADESVDAALLLGPLYHLRERDDRVQALREAARVVSRGGLVFAAVISRWAPRLDGLVALRLYRELPHLIDLVTECESSGDLQPAHPGGFSAYTHRPDELVSEVVDAGLELVDLVGVEGMPLSSTDAEAREQDPADWAQLLESARALERVPELLGLSPHLIAVARRPSLTSAGQHRQLAAFSESDQLRDALFTGVDLRAARFAESDLSNVVMRGVEIAGLDIDAPWLPHGGSLLINGVDVIGYVEAELNKRFPGRDQRRTEDPAGLRQAWAALEKTWSATLERVAAMPAGAVDISVAGEWSFAQTLRHLIFATDLWLGRGTAEPDTPTYEDVLRERAERVAMVRDLLSRVTTEELAQQRRNPHDPDSSETTLSCLHVILEEEWEHLRFATRDLDAIETGDAQA